MNPSLKRLVHCVFDCLVPHTPVFLLRGATRPAGRAGALLQAGYDRWTRYFPNRFFSEPPQCEHLGTYPVWMVPRLLNRHHTSVDLTVARVDQISARLFFDASYFYAPEWVRLCVTVPDTIETLARASRSLRDDLRVVRRNRLQSRITHDEAEFTAFYHNDYVPYTRTRHGEASFVQSPRFLRRLFRRGGLLWVERSGQRLAGLVFEHQGETLRLWAIGATNGNPEVLKQGAIAALYIFAIEYARQRGMATCDLRGCRPSLHDNLLRYKRKWSTTLRDKPDNVYDVLVRWHAFNEVIADFLSHTSLIFRDGDGFAAIHTDVSQARERLWIDGLREIYLADTFGLHPTYNDPTK